MKRMILLLCVLVTLSESNEINKLTKNGVPVMFEVTRPCIMKTTKDFLQPADGIKQFFAVASCQISNSLSEPFRVIVHDDTEVNDIKPPGSTTDPQFRSMFLMQYPNTVSYMILNPEKAYWLFTNELSGCDIFIATKDSQPNMPLVVHANADALDEPNQQVENLKWKGDKVDQILRDFQLNYVLKVRIHITPQQPIPSNYDKYWNDYKTSHQSSVKIYRYSIDAPLVQKIQFYGHYKNTNWEFFVKGKENGVKTDILV
jgi:hypothetical protein